jgi:UDP-glucose 4-epimerase
VNDVAQANLLASEAPERVLGKAYNIAGGQSISLLELLSEIQAIIGSKISPAFEAPRSGDIKESWASIDKAKKDFGYSSKVSLSQGLKKTIDWFLLVRNTAKQSSMK